MVKNFLCHYYGQTKDFVLPYKFYDNPCLIRDRPLCIWRHSVGVQDLKNKVSSSGDNKQKIDQGFGYLCTFSLHTAWENFVYHDLTYEYEEEWPETASCVGSLLANVSKDLDTLELHYEETRPNFILVPF